MLVLIVMFHILLNSFVWDLLETIVRFQVLYIHRIP